MTFNKKKNEMIIADYCLVKNKQIKNEQQTAYNYRINRFII
jgi:hypothetical protein